MRYLTLLVCLILPGAGWSQQGSKDLLIVFKDGFHFKAKVLQDKIFIVDPASGRMIEIAAWKGFLYLEDFYRRIYFSPSEIAKPIVLKQGELSIPDMFYMVRNGFGTRTIRILPGYYFDGAPSDWDKNWERVFKMVSNTGGRIPLLQRIVYLDPICAKVEAREYNWDSMYSTKEFSAAELRDMTRNYLNTKKDYKDLANHQRRFFLAKFLVQCGHLAEAEEEMEALLLESPGQKKQYESFAEKIQEAKAKVQAEDLERMFKVGQMQLAQRRAEPFFNANLLRFVSLKLQTELQDWRIKAEEAESKIKAARQSCDDLLKYLPANKNWQPILKAISDEIDHETVDRLETFVGFARSHLLAKDEGKASDQTTEQIASLAVSGFLLGNGSAEPDPAVALKLWQTRTFLLDYLGTDSAQQRGQKLAYWEKEVALPIDVVARLIKLLPAVKPHAEIDTKVQTVTIDVPNSKGGSYMLQLPPDFQPHRPYPVLIVLHGPEKAEKFIHRFSDFAGKNGYILAAPVWGDGEKSTYGATMIEHALVLDTIKDLRRRFVIDSDRVALFGFGEGGAMAWDVGLSHPDQFCAVIPMAGVVKGFPEKLASNGQYLPFYTIGGDQHGLNSKAVKAIYHDWVRGHYPSLLMEYKGRGFDWFGGELPSAFDWLLRRKRASPEKSLGRVDHELKLTRAQGNRFYWLSSDWVVEKYQSDGQRFPTPARMTATMTVANQADAKTGAKIWTQIQISANGLKQISVWLAPNQVDFNQPVKVQINGSAAHFKTVAPSMALMLEDFYQVGDRQRLFYARLDFSW